MGSSQEPRIREQPVEATNHLVEGGVLPALARVLASRGVANANELDTTLERLLPYDTLKNCDTAAELLFEAVRDNANFLIVADYDADGATAAAIALRFLKAVNAKVNYFVPNRFEHGYGLTPEIADIASERGADWIITVDNGIASVAGVTRAKELGLKVLITDHHLPGETLPPADCIVNPNQKHDQFASKALAGVGVMFYILVALRARLRDEHFFNERLKEPNLAQLLDLVALGTVADVVPLDENNRILVAQGIRRIRSGKCNPGIKALLSAAKKSYQNVKCTDFGFVIGPRLNAAGRLTDMSIGIECLLSDDPEIATRHALELNRLNQERREIESDMKDQALEILDQMNISDSPIITIYDERWHSGIVGILASRIKEQYDRPVIAFASDGADNLKGSGRSMPGLHLRDALDSVTKQYPLIIEKFGGHAMAAGLTIKKENLSLFINAINLVVGDLMTKNPIDTSRLTDGPLSETELNEELAEAIQSGIWGQAFPEPVFRNQFYVREHRLLSDKHTKLGVSITKSGPIIDAIRFNFAETTPEIIECQYKLDINDYYSHRPIQLIIEDW